MPDWSFEVGIIFCAVRGHLAGAKGRQMMRPVVPVS